MALCLDDNRSSIVPKTDSLPISINLPTMMLTAPPDATASSSVQLVNVQLVTKPTLERRLSTGTASTSSTSSATTTSTVRYSVSFADANTIHRYETNYPDQTPLWYTKKELKAMQAEDSAHVQDYTQTNPSYVTSLLQIWSTPCMQEEVLTRLVRPIQTAPIRGLEKHCLKSMKARRGVVLRKVLQAQHYLWYHVPDPEERADLMREECQPLSRTSARFARALALGDAAANASVVE